MFSDLIYQQIPMSESHFTLRRSKVDSVVIHYTAAIVKDAKDVVAWWQQNDPYTSATYIIDVMGRISGVIHEQARPYTTGSYGLINDIDDHAITIEVSTDQKDSDHVSGLSIDALTKLLADIGERYGIYWKFTGDTVGNVHAHRWYQNTPCPGDYLYSKFDLIVDIANYIQYKKEEQKVSEFDERLTALEARLSKVESQTLPAYHSLEDVPEYWQKEVSWCIENEYLKGDPSGDLNLSYDELRSLVVAARMVMAP